MRYFYNQTMKKLTKLCFILLTLISCNNQTVNYSQLNWKVNDQRELTVLVKTNQIGKDTKVDSSFYKQSIQIKVISDSDSILQLEYVEENPVYIHFRNIFSDDVLSKLPNSKITRLYSVEKKIVSTEVEDSGEFIRKIDESKYEIEKLSKSLQYQEKVKVNKQLSQLKFSDETANSPDVLSLLLKQYKYEFLKDSIVKTSDSLANPFDMQQFPGGTVLSYISNREKRNYVDLHLDTRFDFEAYKNGLSAFTSNLGETLFGFMPKEATENADFSFLEMMYAQLISKIQFDAYDEVIITQRCNKRWPEEIYCTKQIKITNAGKIEGLKISTLIQVKKQN